MRVPSRIKKLREERSLTVTEAAERSGVPRSTFEKWEQMGVPGTVAHAVRIADALCVDVRELFRER